MELFLDARSEAKQGTAKYDGHVWRLFVVPPTKQFPAPAVYVKHPFGRRDGGHPVAPLRGVVVGATVHGDGYALELKLPLNNFPAIRKRLSANALFSVGFDIAVSDRDDVTALKRKSGIVWAGTAQNDENAAPFGRLLIESATARKTGK